MTFESSLVRETIDRVYGERSVEEKYRLREFLVSVLEDRRNCSCPNSKFTNKI